MYFAASRRRDRATTTVGVKIGVVRLNGQSNISAIFNEKKESFLYELLLIFVLCAIIEFHIHENRTRKVSISFPDVTNTIIRWKHSCK